MQAEYQKWFRHQGAHRGQSLAVLTSGGDSQGMNATVRAAVRMGIFMGCEVWLVREGYQGLVDGGEMIERAYWASVTSVIHRGGTFIGSARCIEFREHDGRLKAALNLVQRGISNLVVIGGDGSLTGAAIFRDEWPCLLEELVTSGKITPEEQCAHSCLQIVGLVGSIDNDFHGTDMTIGANSALQRIAEAIDAVADTASSHKRTFIMTVMGRRCGHLALTTCLICEADYFFIPESPPEKNWPDQLCEKLAQERSHGKRLNIIVLSEGAMDIDGKPISAEDVQAVIVDRLHHDTRITVLGHVQRGGNPSAYDRLLGCRMGAEAVLTLMTTRPEDEPVVIVIAQHELSKVSLKDSVEKTIAIGTAMENKEWAKAVELRGEMFQRNLKMCQTLTSRRPEEADAGEPVYIAALHMGKPACGMNAALNGFVKGCSLHNIVVLAAQDSIEGLIAGRFIQLSWDEVSGWISQGGSVLGTRRSHIDNRLQEIAESFRRRQIRGLVVIGGFDAYEAVLQLCKARAIYEEFRIPMIVIPVTIDNNVPGTDISVGCDTALNEITDICDRIRQSAQGTKHRVFIIETMGGYSGYLATMGAITSGADTSYIFEEEFDVMSMHQDIKNVIAKTTQTARALILINENASENFNTDFVHRLYKEGGKNNFSCRMNILGHMQQGGTPTPYDRSMAVKFGILCSNWMNEMLQDLTNPGLRNNSACVCGRVQGSFKITPVMELVPFVDFEHRLPLNCWWLKLRYLMRILSKHESAFRSKQFTLFGNTYNICFGLNGPA